MTHITIYTDSDLYNNSNLFNDSNNSYTCIAGFRSEGHAGYADAGEDIVCSAISVLTINTINSIELFTSDKCLLHADEESAVIEFHVTSDKISKEASVLLNALYLGLRGVAEGNPDYVSLNIEEV